MITVRYKDSGKKRRITVDGHANAGEKGQDIFCAAASTLVMTLQSALINSHIKFEQEISTGHADIKCNRQESKVVFYTCMCGFYTLAKMYPDYYTVIS